MSIAAPSRVTRWVMTPYARSTMAGLLGAMAVVETLRRQVGTDSLGALTVLLCLLGLLTTLPALSPSATAAAVVVTASGVLSLAAFDRLTLAGIVAQLVCSFRLGRQRPSPVALLLGLPYLVLALLVRPEAPVIAELLAGAVPVLAGIGLYGRLRREDAENRAVHDAFVGAESEHAARGERARIARDLHDVVAHHISMVAVQAESARLTVPGMPAAGARKLTAIGDTARSALTEMRRLLGVLREDVPTDGPDRRPQPGLAQLGQLIDDARDATGAGTRLILSGRPIALDPGVELAVYRIVQEALTNARRHAPGAAVDVELRYSADHLRLVVRDNGPGDAEAGPRTGGQVAGHGLQGMRERANAVAGRLRAGPGASGGFLVEAVLPGSDLVTP